MAVPTESLLYIFNEASGTSVTDEVGSNNGTLNNSTFAWNQDAGSYEGYLDVTPSWDGTTVQPYVSIPATYGASSKRADFTVAIGFQAHSFDTNGDSQSFLLNWESTDGGVGLTLLIDDPTTSGFNLRITHQNSIGGTDFLLIENLTLSTDYCLVVSFDESASTLYYTIGATSNSVTNAGQWASGNTLNGTTFGRLCASYDAAYNGYYGFNGHLNYFAFWDGWDGGNSTTTDREAINSSPTTALPSWPGLLPVAGTFGDKYGVVQAGLSGLSWAWFDQDVGVLSAPTASGAVATTDLAGAFSIDVTGTALTNGQTGTLVVYDSTNEKFGAYRAIIGANGTVRLDSPVLASSYYFDTQTGTIGIIATPPTGPWR